MQQQSEILSKKSIFTILCSVRYFPLVLYQLSEPRFCLNFFTRLCIVE